MSTTASFFGGPIISKLQKSSVPHSFLFCLSISDSSPTCVTMAKKVVSFPKKKPIKRSSKRTRLRTIFRNFFDYMKSDTYMFSPLISPQSPAAISPASLGEGFSEPIKRKENKLVRELEEYLKCDCHMYAPLVLDSAVETTSAPTGVRSQRKEIPSIRSNLIGQSSEKTMQDSRNRKENIREISRNDRTTPTRRIAIKHALTQKETVKHVVHQNCRPNSIPGKGMFQKETRKIVTLL